MSRQFIDQVTHGLGAGNLSAPSGVPLTISCWIYPTGITTESSNSVVLDLYGYKGGSYLSYIALEWQGGVPAGNPTRYNIVGIASTTPDNVNFYNAQTSFTSNSVVYQNQWNFVSIAVTSTQLTLYVGYSGTLSTINSNITNLSTLNVLSNIEIGRSPTLLGSSTPDFNGYFSNVNVWKEVLTQSDIQNLFNGTPSHCIHPSSLVLSYPMIGPSSTLENCRISNGPPLSGIATVPSVVSPTKSPYLGRAFGPLLMLKEPYSKGYMPLYTVGCLPYSSGGPFDDQSFTTAFYNVAGCGNPPAWSMTLYCSGNPISSGYVPLYMPVNVGSSGNVNLFTWGNQSFNNLMGQFNTAFDNDYQIANPLPLVVFQQGIISIEPPDGTMPLFLYGYPGGNASGSVPLFMWSTQYSGIYNDMPLYLKVPSFIDLSGQINSSMNLFVKEEIGQEITSAMNLFLDVVPTTLSGMNLGMPLFACNNSSYISGVTPLFLQAPSGVLGSIPISGSMNLVIGGTPEIDGYVPLFMSVQGQSSGFVPLWIGSSGTVNNSVSLYLLPSGLTLSNNTNLYIGGY